MVWAILVLVAIAILAGVATRHQAPTNHQEKPQTAPSRSDAIPGTVQAAPPASRPAPEAPGLPDGPDFDAVDDAVAGHGPGFLALLDKEHGESDIPLGHGLGARAPEVDFAGVLGALEHGNPVGLSHSSRKGIAPPTMCDSFEYHYNNTSRAGPGPGEPLLEATRQTLLSD